MDADGLDPKRIGGAGDPDGDFAPVGDEHALEQATLPTAGASFRALKPIPAHRDAEGKP
jgi:hypothetical protein